MKVARIGSTHAYEVIEESPNFYITTIAGGGVNLIPKNEASPVIVAPEWEHLTQPVYIELDWVFDKNGNKITGKFRARLDTAQQKMRP